MDLVEEVASGDRRRGLEAIRDKLADELGRALGPDAARLAKELTSVMRELATVPTGREESTVDDLAARRAHRLAGAADPEHPAAGQQRGPGSG
ncbi:hypothetical protein AB0B89_23670 [Sphaerisporangium sp. NPDC049002]|uniref:hypothetical protein n=1 Tax=Sphaerisporangium sp. NPDC049002 TaxID=3155392 RepID=UPI0033FBB46D